MIDATIDAKIDATRPAAAISRSRVSSATALALGALMLGLSGGTIGCVGLSYPTETAQSSDPQPEARGGAAPVTPPVTLTPAAAAVTIGPLTWAQHSARAREAVRDGDLQSVEENLLAALALLTDRPSHDARVRATLDNLARLAGLYQDQERYEDAGRVLKGVLAEVAAGRETDPVTAFEVVIRQAAYLTANDRRAEVALLYQSALFLRPRDTGSVNLAVELRRSLASIRLADGDTAAAAALIDPTLEQIEADRGADSLSVAALLVDSALIREAEGKLDEAAADLLRAIEIEEKQAPNGLSRARVLNHLADFHNRHGRNAAEAVAYATTAVELIRALGPGGASLVAGLDTLANAEVALGRSADAEQHFAEALGLYDALSPAQRVQVGGVVENYAAFIGSQGRPEEAAAIRAHAEVVNDTAHEPAETEAGPPPDAPASDPAPTDGSSETTQAEGALSESDISESALRETTVFD